MFPAVPKKVLMRCWLLLAVWGLGGQLPLLAQQADWLRQVPNSGGNYVTDSRGNSYADVIYSNTFQVWGFTCAASPNTLTDTDAALLKYNQAGTVQWALTANGNGNERFDKLLTDQAGNVYTTFSISPSQAGGSTTGLGITLGGQALPGIGTYYLRILPTGTVQLLQTLTASNVRLVGSDRLGNVYAAEDSLLVKFDPAGVRSTVRSFPVRRIPGSTSGSGVFYHIEQVKVGPQGDLYCIGDLTGQMNLGTGAGASWFVTSGNPQTTGLLHVACAVRLSATGAVRWAVASAAPQISGSNLDQQSGDGIAVDANGDAYLTGTSLSLGVTFGNYTSAPRPSYYTAKISLAGQPQWVRSAGGCTRTPVPSCAAAHCAVVVDTLGNAYQTGAITATAAPTIDGNPLAWGGGDVYIVSYDPAGNLRWARSLPLATAVVNATGVACMHTDGTNLYLMADVTVPNTRIDQQVALTTGHTLLRFNPAASLAGIVYLDANGNGQQDATEGPFPQSVVLNEAQQQLTYNSSAADGRYYVFGQPGSYSLSLPTPPAHYAVSQPASPPTAYAGVFPAIGQTTTGLNFGLRPVANQPDLRVSLTPYANARPGFITRYRLTVQNVGTTTLPAGPASVVLDSRAVYVSSAPAGSRTGQTVAWTYASLAPNARQVFDVQFSLPLNVAVGTQLNSTANAPVAGDVAPADNTASTPQTVTGSLDPNDLDVNYTRLTLAQVAAGQPLDYTIHFQNLGTDTAFAIVIRDTLNFRKFNLSTLRLVAWSHNCFWSQSGQGALSVSFLNIKLPERNVDVIRSQGFVRFRVQPLTTLVVGDVLPNRAYITFDFNAPVRTNPTTTTVYSPTAVLNNHAALAWDTYPNPAQGLLTIAAELPSAGSVTLQLFDGLGRPVQQHTLVAPAGAFRQALDVSPQAPGLYVLRLRLPDGTVLMRQVVRE